MVVLDYVIHTRYGEFGLVRVSNQNLASLAKDLECELGDKKDWQLLDPQDFLNIEGIMKRIVHFPNAQEEVPDTRVATFRHYFFEKGERRCEVMTYKLNSGTPLWVLVKAKDNAMVLPEKIKAHTAHIVGIPIL